MWEVCLWCELPLLDWTMGSRRAGTGLPPSAYPNSWQVADGVTGGTCAESPEIGQAVSEAKEILAFKVVFVS